MSELFTRTTVSAESHFDLVIMRLGCHQISAPYQNVFDLLAQVLMAAKMASRAEGNSAKVWRDFIQTQHDDVKPITARQFRKSREPWNLERYNVLFEDSIVTICMNELVARFHYADALEFHSMVRVAATAAKAWAGDRSKVTRISAYLNDAEENYRLGLR